MHWNSLDEFLAMGGYGLYVWGSFLVTLVCLVAEVVLLKRGDADARRRLKRLQQWEDKPLESQ
jgi:heme exporter protein D